MISQEIKDYLIAKDPALQPLIAAVELPELQSKDLYLDLMDSIVSQQLSVKAAGTIFSRFLDLFPNRYPHPEYVLALEMEQLRAVGLSGQKANYMRNTATFFLENDLIEKNWEDMEDDDLIAYLTQIKGVGKWTVQMILMFTLQRNNILPLDDLGIQQGMTRLYRLSTESPKILKAAMEQKAEAWKPYRSIASRYIWRYKDAKLEY